MTRRSSLLVVTLFIGAVSGCAVLQPGKAGLERHVLAAHDSLAATQDTLRGVRRQLDSTDSMFALSVATPDSFVVAFQTTRGRFDVMAHSSWAPVGVDRFYELVRRHYYDDIIVFRIVKGFVAQFGISGDPAVNAAWRQRRIADDRTRQSNLRGRVSYASGGPNTRTVQLFINLADNARLDSMPNGTGGYPPIGEVVAGMDVVDSLNNQYGGAPSNMQDSISRQGNAFLRRAFPKLDAIQTARIVTEWRHPR